MLALESIGTGLARGELTWLPAWQPVIGGLAAIGAVVALAAFAAAIGTVIRVVATAERRAAAYVAP